MTPGPVRWLTLACIASLLGCAAGPAGWRHFHGDLPNSGFLPVRSGYAVSPAWKSPPFAVTGSSPVLGRLADGREAVYVGTADAQLVALDAANGRVLWQTVLRSASGRSAIVSSPSVAPDGGVVVVVTTEAPGGGLQSTLHKVDRSGVRRWSFSFPDSGFFLGSPRSVGFGQEDLVIAVGTTERPAGLRSALLVVRDEGDEAQLLDQKDMGDCVGTGIALERAQRSWRALSQPAGAALPADLRLDPSPAALASGSTLLVAAVDVLCRAGVWEWDGRRLATVWKSTHAGEDHSSPAMLANRLVAFGRGDGRLVGYDVRTGVKMWEYDAGEPVVSTPSESSEGLLYVASLQHLHAVTAATGSAGPAGPQRLRFQGPTLASPAVTADCVYLPAREMLTVSHNFKVRSHNTDFVGNGLSSPAVGANGSVYVVAADGTVWKYKGH